MLRAVIGLVAIDDGEVLWNGRPVLDRAAFFVPPQCAYVAQVPRMFAESLQSILQVTCRRGLIDDIVPFALHRTNNRRSTKLGTGTYNVANE